MINATFPPAVGAVMGLSCANLLASQRYSASREAKYGTMFRVNSWCDGSADAAGGSYGSVHKAHRLLFEAV